MQKALRIQSTVQPGRKIEVNTPELKEGETVEIIILVIEPASERQSAVDILANLPGQQMFKSAEEVTSYLQEERDSWER